MRYPTPALWRVRPLEVHDGDTITVEVDRGTDDRSTWRIRLKDVYDTQAYITAAGYDGGTGAP